MKTLKYRVGDRVKREAHQDLCGGIIVGVRDDPTGSRYDIRWDSDPCRVNPSWQAYELVPEVIPDVEKDPMEAITSMLIMTGLAQRLGVPQPCDVDMSWDDPEYLLWILWRCDALVGKQ